MLRKRRLLTCRACGYKWLTRIFPRKCPKCHNNWKRKLKHSHLKNDVRRWQK